MNNPNEFDVPPPPDHDFYVSTEKRLLDHRWLVANLLAQPWTECWTQDRMHEAIANSQCFGVYRHDATQAGEVPKADRMVGFARVISDGATFSMLVDVVVAPEFRGQGIARKLIDAIVNHPSVKNTVCTLRTSTCAGLYEKFGFTDVFGAMRRIPQ